MHPNVAKGQPGAVFVVIAAALAAVVALGLLGTVAAMFQGRGVPLGQVAAAERACIAHVYVSAREACMREHLRLLRETTASRSGDARAQ